MLWKVGKTAFGNETIYHEIDIVWKIIQLIVTMIYYVPCSNPCSDIK